MLRPITRNDALDLMPCPGCQSTRTLLETARGAGVYQIAVRCRDCGYAGRITAPMEC